MLANPIVWRWRIVVTIVGGFAYTTLKFVSLVKTKMCEKHRRMKWKCFLKSFQLPKRSNYKGSNYRVSTVFGKCLNYIHSPTMLYKDTLSAFFSDWRCLHWRVEMFHLDVTEDVSTEAVKLSWCRSPVLDLSLVCAMEFQCYEHTVPTLKDKY